MAYRRTIEIDKTVSFVRTAARVLCTAVAGAGCGAARRSPILATWHMAPAVLRRPLWATTTAALSRAADVGNAELAAGRKATRTLAGRRANPGPWCRGCGGGGGLSVTATAATAAASNDEDSALATCALLPLPLFHSTRTPHWQQLLLRNARLTHRRAERTRACGSRASRIRNARRELESVVRTDRTDRHTHTQTDKGAYRGGAH